MMKCNDELCDENQPAPFCFYVVVKEISRQVSLLFLFSLLFFGSLFVLEFFATTVKLRFIGLVQEPEVVSIIGTLPDSL